MKIRSRFFSVSPMYFETTVARSTRNRSSPRSRRRAPARPSSSRFRTRPANSTLSPWVRATGRLVAPLGQHPVAVAQVRRDRAQHLELALGEHQVVPAVTPGRAATRARRGASSRHAVRRGRDRPPAAPARRASAPRSGSTSAAARICSTESRNFAATSPGSPTPVSPPTRRGARRSSGAGRRRRRAVRSLSASASRLGRRSAPGPLAAARRSRASSRAALGRRQVARARRSRAARPRARAASAASRERVRVARARARRAARRGPPAAAATIAAASGPQTTSGSLVSAASSERDLARPPRRRPGPAPSARTRRIGERRAGVAEARAGAEQEGGEPIGDLDQPVRERRRRLGSRAGGSRRVPPAGRRGEAREHVGLRDAAAAEQRGRQPRARELPRHVVVQVGVEPAVARMQLGRAHSASASRLERVEPEQGGRARAGSVGDLRTGPRRPAQAPARRRCRAPAAGRRGLRRGRRRPRRRPGAARRGTRTSRSWRISAVPHLARIDSASRSLASPGCETLSGPRRGRTALLDHVRHLVGDQLRGRLGSPGGTRPARRRCRCRR